MGRLFLAVPGVPSRRLLRPVPVRVAIAAILLVSVLFLFIFLTPGMKRVVFLFVTASTDLAVFSHGDPLPPSIHLHFLKTYLTSLFSLCLSHVTPIDRILRAASLAPSDGRVDTPALRLLFFMRSFVPSFRRRWIFFCSRASG